MIISDSYAFLYLIHAFWKKVSEQSNLYTDVNWMRSDIDQSIFVPSWSVTNSLSCLPNIIYCNARSLKPKIDELQAIVDNNKANIVSVSETWLDSDIPDSSINLTDFTIFRKDRPSHTGGVSLYLHSSVPATRLYECEIIEVESLWIKIRPCQLPRYVSNAFVLVAVVYYPTSCGAIENQTLLRHLQTNVEDFLRCHPEGLIMIIGDFDPKNIGLPPAETKRYTGLTQIVNVLTRDTGILDWCLTNKPTLFNSPKQLPKLGSSDHYTVSITP